jgi:flagellar hook-associated protein 3 FlgL
MRISTNQQFETYTRSIRTAQESYFGVQKQITSGRRWSNAFEDPLSARLSINSRQLKSRFEQFDKNLRGADDYLKNTEVALTDVGDALTKAKVLAVQAASSTIDPTAAEALANQVTALQDRLVRSANWQGSQGQHIFGGQISDAKPFAASSGVLTFSGDTNAIQTEVRSGEYMRINLDASTHMVDIYETLETLKNHIRSLDTIQISSVSIANLDSAIAQNTSLRGETGAKMQTVESLKVENERRIDEFTKEISDHEEIDLAEAMVRYQQTEVAYTAAMQVASQGMRLSLMDFMR